MTLGATLGLWTTIPFAVLLLCIAIFPLSFPHWWEKNRNKMIVTALVTLPTVFYVGARLPDGVSLLTRPAAEYFSFIMLLAALFTVSGGIYLTGNLVGTPLVNGLFLAGGAILSNFIGTTGASMILIRPLIRTNSERKHNIHIFVFFIFVVSNCGGLLTPLGDPPLFLGFLRGVPFFWTLRLFPYWALCVGLIMTVFMVIETVMYGRESIDARVLDASDYVPLRAAGKINFLFLAGILAAVFLPGLLRQHQIGEEFATAWGFPWRETAMGLMLAASLKFGPTGPRASNHFTFGAIAEVAIVFAGIFGTMIPPLEILKARGGQLGLTQPWQFFWVTGALSSVLDNAPTYLTFASTALGRFGLHDIGSLTLHPDSEKILAAISTGAVFMGANTYIGNAPNFMVRSICEHAGIKMPSFFGYMLYSALVLLPIFAVVTWVYFL